MAKHQIELELNKERMGLEERKALIFRLLHISRINEKIQFGKIIFAKLNEGVGAGTGSIALTTP